MPPYKDKIETEKYCLFLADCLEVLPTLEAGSVDAVVTDPPYGVAGGKGGISRARNKADYASIDDSRDFVLRVVVPVVEMCIKISKRCVITPGSRHMFDYPRPYETGCFYYPAGTGMSRWGFNCYQPIYFYGPSPNAGTLGHHNSRRSTEPSDASIDHPCPKPIGDWTWLTSIACRDGETVLDPFMGSGTTGVACMKLGRKFIGIEIDENYFRIAAKRIAKAAEEPPLFKAAREAEQRELFAESS